jgi:hypothetical protein
MSGNDQNAGGGDWWSSLTASFTQPMTAPVSGFTLWGNNDTLMPDATTPSGGMPPEAAPAPSETYTQPTNPAPVTSQAPIILPPGPATLPPAPLAPADVYIPTPVPLAPADVYIVPSASTTAEATRNDVPLQPQATPQQESLSQWATETRPTETEDAQQFHSSSAKLVSLPPEESPGDVHVTRSANSNSVPTTFVPRFVLNPHELSFHVSLVQRHLWLKRYPINPSPQLALSPYYSPLLLGTVRMRWTGRSTTSWKNGTRNRCQRCKTKPKP